MKQSKWGGFSWTEFLGEEEVPEVWVISSFGSVCYQWEKRERLTFSTCHFTFAFLFDLKNKLGHIFCDWQNVQSVLDLRLLNTGSSSLLHNRIISAFLPIIWDVAFGHRLFSFSKLLPAVASGFRFWVKLRPALFFWWLLQV